MNKLIIIGHPSSDVEEVERILVRSGMRPALVSRRENLRPREITSALLKAHCTPSSLSSDDVLHAETPASFGQIEIGAIWHELLLDLFLGNIDQSLWGWADSEALPLLDYWCKSDPNIFFILVYDKPSCALTKPSRSIAPQAVGENSKNIQKELSNWTAYNNELLRFFRSHSDRCLLVHHQSVMKYPEAFLICLREKFPVSVSLPTDVVPGNLMESLRLASSLVDEYIAEALLMHSPACLQLFAELQSTANVPLGNLPERLTSDLVWDALTEERRLAAETVGRLTTQVNQLRFECDNLKRSRSTAEQNQDQPQSYPDSDQRDPLLLELFKAQAELEKRTQENRQLKAAIAQGLGQSSGLIGAVEEIKSRLPYRLGSTMIAHSHTFAGCLGMPFALLRVYFHWKSEIKRKAPQPCQLPSAYSDMVEAKILKQKLAYRLGITLIKNIKTPWGWVRLPFALRHEVKVNKLNQQKKTTGN